MAKSTNNKKVTSFFGNNSESHKTLHVSKLSSDIESLSLLVEEKTKIIQDLTHKNQSIERENALKLGLIKKLQTEIRDLKNKFEQDLKLVGEESKKVEEERLAALTGELRAKIDQLEISNQKLKNLNLNHVKIIKRLTSEIEKLVHIEAPKPVVVETIKPEVKEAVPTKPIRIAKIKEVPVSTERIALFTSVNSTYFEHSVMSFNSYDIANPGVFDFYIITSDTPTKEQQELCQKNRVKFINQNLFEDFKIEQDWPYPSECYWIFKGPELFYEMGYQYSMSVDADTYCNLPLDFSWVNEINLFAGSVRLDASQMKHQIPAKKIKAFDFLNKVGKISKIESEFGSFNKNIDSINSGVIVFNNKKCASFRFYDKMVSLFKKTKMLGYPRKGDDSLLSMFMVVEDPKLFTHIGPDWNYYYLFPEKSTKNILDSVKIVHMTRIKPWRYDLLYMVKNQNIRNVILEWHKNEKQNMKATHKVWWYRPRDGYNFGDEITPWLLEKMFDIKLEKPCNPKDQNVMLGVGSIMRLANQNTEVWGSGIRNVDQSDFEGASQFHAVRGPFSRKRLIELGMKCPSVFGDPGLLLPTYYNPKISAKWDLGIIPHLVDWDIVQERFGHLPNVKFIDLNTNDIESVVDQMLECKHIVSTSLHGIITAVAYGIPVKWLKASDNINGDDIKFYDFWASLDLDVFKNFDYKNNTVPIQKYQPLRMHLVETIDDLIESTNIIPMERINIKRLINTCPFRLA